MSYKKEIIGVCDIGASGGKIFIAYFTADKLQLQEVYRFSNRPISFFQKSHDGQISRRWCWDFEGIWQEVLNGLSVIAGLGDINMISFGIDTWGSDGTWIDKSGDMLSPIGTGRDGRWGIARQDILKNLSAKKLFHITGIQSYSFNVINQIYWYVKYNPNLVSLAETYMPFHSLLYYYLTGLRVAEYTWMSTTQLCKAGRQEYSRDIFEIFGLPLNKMPNLISPMVSLGLCYSQLAKELNIPRFKVIIPAVHDTACAYITAPVNSRTNSLIISSGTWALTGICMNKPDLTEGAFRLGFSNEAGAEGNIRFLKNIMGTWPAQQLRHQWSMQDGAEMSWDVFDKLAESAHPGKYILDIDDPVFFGAADMEAAIRTYCLKTKQKLPTERCEMACAVYESLALKIAMVADDVSSITNKSLDEVVLLGGAVRSKILAQWISNASNLPIKKGPIEATATGNAFLQAKALGWIDSLRDIMTAGNEIIAIQNDNYWSESKEILKNYILNK